MRTYFKLLCLASVLLWLLNSFGVFDHLFFQISFAKFKWPPFVDVKEQVRRIRRKEVTQFVHFNQWKFGYVHEPKHCESGSDKSTLRIVIKSKSDHFVLRNAIRELWGQEREVRNFRVRRTFLLGLSENEFVNEAVRKEHANFGDILQGDFLDKYKNNTLKALMGFQWLVKECSEFKFALFVDDDYHVSVQNAAKLLAELPTNDKKLQLFTGFRFDTSPFRNRWHKHYISVQEYPFSRYPAYIAAGAYLMSKTTVEDFYWASYFVKLFPYDDVYFGIIAKLLDITPKHNENFLFWEQWFYVKSAFREVIAAHGFSDVKLMQRAFDDSETKNYE